MADEKYLVKGCCREDTQAQRMLFQQYAAKMLAICMRYCKNEEDAKDAMQDGFVKILFAIKKFNYKSSLETWMTRIMINTAIDNFKRNIKYNLFEDDSKVADESSDDMMVEDTNDLGQEDLLKIIQGLPDGYRMIFNLYAIEGLQHKEIAAQLGISEGTSKSQLARARKLLQEKVKKLQKQKIRA